MDPNQHRGWYAEAFIAVLAAAAGLRLAKPQPDVDGLDYCMWPDTVGRFRGARSTPINVQVKSAIRPGENATHWSHSLAAAHFNALAGTEVTFPTFLFFVVVPPNWQDFTDADHDRLLLCKAAYWHSLSAEELIPAQGAQSRTVRVPKANLLTVDTLRGLATIRTPAEEAHP